MEIVPISPVQRATELYRDRGLVQGPTHFHFVRHVLRCRGHRGPNPCSSRVHSQTLDFGWQASPALWTRVACHARLDTPDARATSSQHWLGWSGGLVMDALALVLPIWRPASSAKALVDGIFTTLAEYFEVLLFMDWSTLTFKQRNLRLRLPRHSQSSFTAGVVKVSQK